jgi:hypothetical protein
MFEQKKISKIKSLQWLVWQANNSFVSLLCLVWVLHGYRVWSEHGMVLLTKLHCICPYLKNIINPVIGSLIKFCAILTPSDHWLIDFLGIITYDHIFPFPFSLWCSIWSLGVFSNFWLVWHCDCLPDAMLMRAWLTVIHLHLRCPVSLIVNHHWIYIMI